MSVNKVILVGRVGTDPVIRTYGEGDSARKNAAFALATSEWSKNGDQFVESTEWHNIVCWGRAAEAAERKAQKGRTLYIEGKIRTRKYNDKNGEEKYAREILASDVQSIENGNGASSGGGNRYGSEFNQSSFSQGGGRQPGAKQSSPAAYDDLPM